MRRTKSRELSPQGIERLWNLILCLSCLGIVGGNIHASSSYHASTPGSLVYVRIRAFVVTHLSDNSDLDTFSCVGSHLVCGFCPRTTYT